MRALAAALLALPACRDANAFAAPAVTRVELGVLTDAFAERRTTLTLANESGADWDVVAWVPSCGCLRVASAPELVPAGTELELELVYEPRGMRGTFAQTLAMRLADGRTLPLVELSGLVASAPFAEPESISVGTEGIRDVRLRVTLPWPGARVTVGEAPSDVVLVERGRTAHHGGELVDFDVAPARERADATLAEVRGVRLLVEVPGRESVALYVPVLRSRGRGARPGAQRRGRRNRGARA